MPAGETQLPAFAFTYKIGHLALLTIIAELLADQAGHPHMTSLLFGGWALFGFITLLDVVLGESSFFRRPVRRNDSDTLA